VHRSIQDNVGNFSSCKRVGPTIESPRLPISDMVAVVQIAALIASRLSAAAGFVPGGIRALRLRLLQRPRRNFLQ
jgi:hypothetical protein